MDQAEKKELQKYAAKIRLGVIEAVHAASSGHPGGSLSIAEILSYLYFREMNINPENPCDPDRDRLVLSKGHCAPALYAALANRGYFPVEHLTSFRNIESDLQGHPNMNDTPGVDMTTGSLGLGISAACGMALSAKHTGKSYRTFAILGDGELDEGQVWEAAMFASHYKLDNLTAFVDLNGLQIDGSTKDVMNTAPVDEKFRSFGWHVICIDEHDLDAIENAVNEAKSISGKPTVIICKGIKGKGVSFMENQCSWHGTAPNDEQYEQAKSELEAQLAAI